jgi:hypothetical protein
MIKTVLSVVVAVGLIVGALYVRGTFIEGDGAVAAGSEAPAGGMEGLTIVCDAALGDGCPAEAQPLDLGELLNVVTDPQTAPDVLVAPSAVVALLEESQVSRVAFGDPRPVATTAVVVVVHEPRIDAVERGCDEAVTWECVQQVVRGGEITTGITDPATSSEGLLGRAALVGGHLGTTDYNANAFGDAAFIAWLDEVVQASSVQPDPVSTLIQFSGAQNDAALTWEATGGATARRGAQRTPTVTLWPEPVTRVDVVAVGVDGVADGQVEAVAAQAADALQQAGWRDPAGAPVGDGPALPDDDGLPGGGVLFSLRETVP